MIIVDIAGGLGNQMFQYAFGQALSRVVGEEVRYSVDSLGSYNTVRILELEQAFDIVVPRASSEEISSVIGSWRSPTKIRRILSHSRFSFLRGRRFIVEGNDFCDILSSGAYFHGYWQSQNYFSKSEPLIRKCFRFKPGLNEKNQEALAKIRSQPSIAIHIRRGDYVSNRKALITHGTLDSQYYLSAISYLRDLLPEARVFAFSDDHNWVLCEILSKINNFEIITHNTGKESFRDMQLMAACDHMVIANSSFSWWAAWLNPNPSKIVIAPKRWFANQNLTDKYIVPSKWERM